MSIFVKRFTTNGSAEQKSLFAFRLFRAAKQESMYVLFSSSRRRRHCLAVNGGFTYIKKVNSFIYIINQNAKIQLFRLFSSIFIIY
jgi:hypothetical protein